MQDFSAAPREMVASFWRNRRLIVTMTKREVIGRYRGSLLGILWSFFNPLLMLAIYTFVFTVVFKARWGIESDSKVEFALILFVGMLIFNLFAECITRAPGVILGNANYVKKVVFPLEILPWVTMGSALVHTAVSLVAWLLFYVAFFGLPSPTVLLFPLVLVPLILVTMGLSWFLASLGVFVRDVSQIIGIVVTSLMFLSPIFYPVSALPETYRFFLYANPLTLIIEQAREVLIWGRAPNWTSLILFLPVAATLSWLGFAWFQKTRRGFADVI